MELPPHLKWFLERVERESAKFRSEMLEWRKQQDAHRELLTSLEKWNKKWSTTYQEPTTRNCSSMATVPIPSSNSLLNRDLQSEIRDLQSVPDLGVVSSTQNLDSDFIDSYNPDCESIPSSSEEFINPIPVEHNSDSPTPWDIESGDSKCKLEAMVGSTQSITESIVEDGDSSSIVSVSASTLRRLPSIGLDEELKVQQTSLLGRPNSNGLLGLNKCLAISIPILSLSPNQRANYIIPDQSSSQGDRSLSSHQQQPILYPYMANSDLSASLPEEIVSKQPPSSKLEGNHGNSTENVVIETELIRSKIDITKKESEDEQLSRYLLIRSVSNSDGGVGLCDNRVASENRRIPHPMVAGLSMDLLSDPNSTLGQFTDCVSIGPGIKEFLVGSVFVVLIHTALANTSGNQGIPDSRHPDMHRLVLVKLFASSLVSAVSIIHWNPICSISLANWGGQSRSVSDAPISPQRIVREDAVFLSGLQFVQFDPGSASTKGNIRFPLILVDEIMENDDAAEGIKLSNSMEGIKGSTGGFVFEPNQEYWTSSAPVGILIWKFQSGVVVHALKIIVPSASSDFFTLRALRLGWSPDGELLVVFGLQKEVIHDRDLAYNPGPASNEGQADRTWGDYSLLLDILILDTGHLALILGMALFAIKLDPKIPIALNFSKGVKKWGAVVYTLVYIWVDLEVSNQVFPKMTTGRHTIVRKWKDKPPDASLEDKTFLKAWVMIRIVI